MEFKTKYKIPDTPLRGDGVDKIDSLDTDVDLDTPVTARESEQDPNQLNEKVILVMASTLIN